MRHLVAAQGKQTKEYKTFHLLSSVTAYWSHYFRQEKHRGGNKTEEMGKYLPLRDFWSICYNHCHAHASRVHEQTQSLMTNYNINGTEMNRQVKKTVHAVRYHVVRKLIQSLYAGWVQFKSLKEHWATINVCPYITYIQCIQKKMNTKNCQINLMVTEIISRSGQQNKSHTFKFYLTEAIPLCK
jgi:hypothetical protein